MIRFIIASRKIPELDMEKYIGEFEFSVVPRSLFASEGKLLLGTSKSGNERNQESSATNR